MNTFRPTSAVIAMAGRGSRLSGLGVPKMLVRTASGQTILQCALEGIRHLAPEIHWHFIVLKEHVQGFQLDKICQEIVGDAELNIIQIDQPTSGQLKTTCLAREFISPDEQLIVHNCDTHISASRSLTVRIWDPNVDGCLLGFNSSDPNYSYMQLDEGGYIKSVIEKPACPAGLASTGTSVFTRADTLFTAAEEVMRARKTGDGELHLSLAYDWLVNTDSRLKAEVVESCHPIGTHKELEQCNLYHQEQKQHG